MGRRQAMTRATTICSGTMSFERLCMPHGHSDAPDPQQQRTNEQGEKEWVHVPFRRLTRPPVVGRCLTSVPGRGFGCRRMATSWTVGRDDERLAHHDRMPWRRDACHAWAERLACRHVDDAQGAGA